MKRLRVGVVGVGHLGQHHARILATMPGVELVGVADADARPGGSRRRQVRRRRPCTTTVSSWTPSMPSRSPCPPSCIARSPAPSWPGGSPRWSRSRWPARLAEAEQLAALARANGAVLQVGHIERFNPALPALDQLPIRPKYITAERLSTYTFRSTDIGVVLDLMIHDLDLLLSMIAAPVRSVAAVGLSLFGEHEDVANARIEFEDGSVANLTASRASYAAVRKMRIWGAEGYASLDFAAKQATLVRPSEQLRRGRLDLDGLDLSQPAAIKDHLFGKILRVDQVPCESAEPLALELEDFVAAARGDARPRVGGEDALRAMRLADQVLRSLEGHRWDGEAAATAAPSPPVEAGSVLQGPHAWRIKSLRGSSSNAAQERP